MDSEGSDAGTEQVDETPGAVAPLPTAARQIRTIVMVSVAAVVVATDQLTKWWALRALDDGPIDLFWTLRLRLVFNTRSAFSLVGGVGPVLGLVAVIIAGALLWLGRISPDRRTTVVLGVIAGGAVGNLSDRIFRADDGFMSGAVIDFIDVQFWPVWNVADMAIVLGGIALVLVTSWDR